MALGSNPFNTSGAPPTFADIQRRSKELLAYHNRRKSAQASATPAEPGIEEDIRVLEELAQEHDEQQETAEIQEPYTVEDPQPPVGHPPESSAPPLPVLDCPALHGIAGFLVRTLAPYTEADPAAVLLQFLAAFGNLVGPAPHCRVGATRHGLNLFVVLVGESSKARKGTSWRQISSLFAEADPFWSAHRVTTARPTPRHHPPRAARSTSPVTDRRLFLLSEEFASVLHVLGREAGQLSPLLRCAWDGGDLCAHDGHRSVQATAAHISLVGHVTQSRARPPSQSHRIPQRFCQSLSLDQRASQPIPTRWVAAFHPNSTPRWPRAAPYPRLGARPKRNPLLAHPSRTRAMERSLCCLEPGSRGRIRRRHQPRRSPGPAPQRHLCRTRYAARSSTPAISRPPWPCGTTAPPVLASSSTPPPSIPPPNASARPSTSLPEGLIQGANQGPFPSPCKQRANRPGSRTTADARPHQSRSHRRPRTGRNPLEQAIRPRDRRGPLRCCDEKRLGPATTL